MTEDDSAKSYWQGLAQSYAAAGAPLRPSREDIEFLESAMAECAARRKPEHLRALLLGVTPDIAAMRWPEGTRLTAADNSFSMVRAVWPGNVPGRRLGVCANWLALPVRESSCDAVIGDGSMNCVRFPAGFRALAESVRGVLREDGISVLRCYTRPVPGEGPDEVFEDLRRGEIVSFHHFKFRLLMAMQESTEQGIAVAEVYREWMERKVDLGALSGRAGWEKKTIDTMELYRGRETVHTFPSMAEFRSVLSEHFEELGVSSPSYSLSERCPVLVLRPRR